MDYILFFIMCIAQPICIPVPEASTIIIGILFIGPLWTFILGIIGMEIGLIIMYFITSSFKGKYLKKYENNPKYNAYQHYMSKNPFLTTGILFTIPILPDEIVIIGSVLANIPLRLLILISIFAKVISIGFLAFSNVISELFLISQWQVILVTLLIMLVFAFIYKKLNS